MTTPVGKVFLVGAGPGDPGLITVRGARLLQEADIVVTDALVSPRLFAGVRGKIIDAGKRGPRTRNAPAHGPTQSFINRLLIQWARRGKNVVRLKGGDPFIFGRGSEELEALRAARIPFEVVPGVTSASAVPAYAGIPITDRRWASHVTFVTGHEKPGKNIPGIDWARLSPDGTLVVLMGVLSWPDLAQRLIAHGWSPELPVAAIENGTTPRQRVLRASLETSVRVFKDARLAAPAVVVVGRVAALGDGLAWVTRERPLFGKKIVVTRAVDSNDRLAALIEAEGAEALACPLIRVRPLSSPALKGVRTQAMTGRAPYDWLIFLSANAVKIFVGLWPEAPRRLRHVSVVAVGPQTAAAAETAGFRVQKTPAEFTSSAVRRVLGAVRGQRLLLPRARVAPPALVQALTRAGAAVDIIPIYETEFLPLSSADQARLADGVDAVTFLSASTVEAFHRALSKTQRKNALKNAVVVSIGPMTTAAIRRLLNVRPVEARVATADGVMTALRGFFRRK